MSPTRAELEAAFIAADDAGNAEDAQAFADALHAYDSDTPPWSKLQETIPADLKAAKEAITGGIEKFGFTPEKAVGDVASGVAQAVRHPIDTAKALYDDAVENYGSPQKIRKSLINHPLKTTVDVAGLAIPAIGLARKGIEVSGLTRLGELSKRGTPGVADVGGEVAPGTTGLATPSKAAGIAEDILYQKLIDSGWTPDRIAARLKWMGPGATLADIDPFAGVAEASAQFPKGALRAKRELGSRSRGTAQRLNNIVDNTLSDENLYKSMDYQRAVRSAEAQPLRRKALEESSGRPIKNHLITRLQKESPYFNQAMALGKKISREEAAREGLEIPETETWWYGGSETDAVHPNVVQQPTLRMLDAAKQGYQAMLNEKRNKFTGQIDNADPETVELSKTVDALTDALRQHSSTYGEYLDKWSEHSQQLAALDRGRKVLDNDPELTLKVIRSATPNELLDMQTGLARALKDKIASDPQAAARYFNKGSVREKMRAMFPETVVDKDGTRVAMGGKRAFKELHKNILREIKKQETANKNLAGSATSARREGAGEIRQTASDVPAEVAGLGLDVATKNPVGFMRRIGRMLGRSSDAAAEQLTKDVADEISAATHVRDPIIQSRITSRIRSRYGDGKTTSGLTSRGMR